MLFRLIHPPEDPVPNWITQIQSFSELNYITGTMSLKSDIFSYTIPHLLQAQMKECI